ncbi:hypothetical protein RB601_002289 [Gaeumannomyces tritici]
MTAENTEKAPEPEQTKLVERFMHLAPQAREPQPLDFGQLTAKLNALSHPEAATPSPERVPPWGPGERPRTISPGETPAKDHQIYCYNRLVAEGGRPPFPLEILDEVDERPRDFIETVRPWAGDNFIAIWSMHDLAVFERPMQRWREFRRWQRDNRNIQAMKERDEGWERVWKDKQLARRQERETHREVPGGTFEEYLEAARRRLRENGLDEDLQLLEDAKQQSERVTWMEYLVFEYWWLERRTLWVDYWEKRCPFIWEKITSLGLLKDGETREDVLRLSRKDMDEPGSPQTTKRRNGISRFLHAVDEGRGADVWKSSQQRPVEWALSQLPEIEAEAALKKKTRGGAKRRGRQPVAKKRKRGEDEGEGARRREPRPRPRKKRMVAELESSTPPQNTRASNRDGLGRSARIKGLGKGTQGRGRLR